MNLHFKLILFCLILVGKTVLASESFGPLKGHNVGVGDRLDVSVKFVPLGPVPSGVLFKVKYKRTGENLSTTSIQFTDGQPISSGISGNYNYPNHEQWAVPSSVDVYPTLYSTLSDGSVGDAVGTISGGSFTVEKEYVDGYSILHTTPTPSVIVYAFVTYNGPIPCPPDTDISANSLDFEIGLGVGDFGNSSAKLLLNLIKPPVYHTKKADLFHWASLRQLLPANYEIRNYTNTAYWGQIIASNFVLQASTNGSGYKLTFHERPVSPTILSNHLWSLTSPYRTITVTNVSLGTDDFGYLIEDGTNISVFRHNVPNGTWTLTNNHLLKKELTVSTNSELDRYKFTYNPVSSDLVFASIKYFERTNHVNLMTMEVFTNSPMLTNFYEYYHDTARFGQIKSIDHYNGFWAEYTNDTGFGSIASGFKNSIFGDTNNARILSTNYASTSPQITITETIGGKIIAKKFITTPSSIDRKQIERVALSTNATISTSGNLVSTNFYDEKGRITAINHQDGTLTTRAYSEPGTNYVLKTNWVNKGSATSSNTVWEGVQEVEVIGSAGQIIVKASYLIHEGSVLTAAPLSLDSYSYAATDYFLNNPTITHLDGTTSVLSGCSCGTGNTESSADRDGVVTDYFYDALNRLTNTTIRGISTIQNFDAAGNLLSIDRIGTNSISEGLLSRLYDLTGRLTNETILGKGTTSISEAIINLQLVRTYTYPNGGTRIETFYRDGSLQSIGGTAALPLSYDYDVATDGTTNFFTIKTTKGNNTNEYEIVYMDMAKRLARIVDSSSNITHFGYNSKGQLERIVDADNVTQVFAYNDEGDLEFSGYVSSPTDAFSLSTAYALKQITNETHFETNIVGGVTNIAAISTTKTYGYPTSNNTSRVLLRSVSVNPSIGRTETRLYPGSDENTYLLESAQVEFSGTGTRWVTNTFADGSYSLNTYSSGLLVSSAKYDSNGTPIDSSVIEYDAHERIKRTTASSGIVAEYDFTNGLLSSQTVNSIGDVLPAQVTQYFYDSWGQPIGTLLPDGVSTTTNEYYLTGLLKHSSGFGRYPSSYTYDGVGRRTFMTNWSSFPSTGARVTQWQYNDQGRLQKKVAAGTTNETSYAYSPGGRVQTVAFPDAVERSQNYNEAGRISAIYFSTNTPGMTNRYNRLGQVDAMQQGESTLSYSLDFLGNMLSESFTGGALNGIALSRGLDHFLRVTNISVNSTPSANQAYAYDAVSRLQSASMLGHSANYSYDTASGLIKTIGYQKANYTRFTEGRGFDEFLRLKQLAYTNWAGKHILPQRENAFNILSQITAVSFDGIDSAIGYDGIGQIAGLTNKWANDTAPVAGQIWNFTFNDIGNRIDVDSGGDVNGANLYNTYYNSDLNNQYQSIYNSGAYQVMGEADAGTLNVNGSTSGVTRHGSYFHKQISVTASGSGTQALVRVDLTNGSAYATPLSGSVYIPPAFEELTYTPKGNLLTDGRWTYRWDAWDRLTRLDRRSPSEPVERIEFEYDHLGRRIQKTVTFTNASIVTTKFIHDGWKLIAELDSGFNLVRSYLWGADLSQTRDGAAGVNGLVGVNIQTNGFYFATSDGRGNVTGLIRPTVSAPSVRNDYSPFGELIRASGELAEANPLRYSTKYFDDETGLIYFGHRYYHPAQGRWTSPDPIEESGGLNLFGLGRNDPINSFDPLGQEITYHYGGESLVQPQGAVPYLAGQTFLENTTAAIFNTLPLAVNSMTTAFSQVADSTDKAINAAATGIGNLVTHVTGEPQFGQGARNVILVASFSLPFKFKCVKAKTKWGPEHGLGNLEHNNTIEELLDYLYNQGKTELRKNRVQRNAAGQRVFTPDGSYTRPDAAWVDEEVRYNYNRVSNLDNLDIELKAFKNMRDADPAAVNILEF